MRTQTWLALDSHEDSQPDAKPSPDLQLRLFRGHSVAVLEWSCAPGLWQESLLRGATCPAVCPAQNRNLWQVRLGAGFRMRQADVALREKSWGPQKLACT